MTHFDVGLIQARNLITFGSIRMIEKKRRIMLQFLITNVSIQSKS
jgi:hypothetical protein